MQRLKLLILVLSLTGCWKTFSIEGPQTNPWLFHSDPEIIRQSSPLMLDIGDYEFRDKKLRSIARFVIISKDRIKFHVDLTHKWRKHADPKRWKVALLVDGEKYEPDDISVRALFTTTIMWDEEARQAYYDGGGRMLAYSPRPKELTPLKSLTAHVGWGTYSFYVPDVVTKDTREITLKLVSHDLKRKLVFTWTLVKE